MNIKEKLYVQIDSNLYECNICKCRFTKFGIGTHIWRVHTDKGKTFDSNRGYKDGIRQAWNKGLTKNTNECIKKTSETLKRRYASGEITVPWKGKKLTEEHKEKLRKALKGYCPNNRPGIGNGGWYKGYYCYSSWELAFVIYNLEHNIKFERNTKAFDYINTNNEVHKYYPDFIIENGDYVEIKGYETENDKLKINSFKEPLIVLRLKELTPYLDYVINKYGRNFINLYEGTIIIKPITKEERLNIKHKKHQEKMLKHYAQKIKLIKECNTIDYTKFGWVNKVSELIKIQTQAVNKFMKRYCPDILEKAFKKKSNKICSVSSVV